jgi:ubiquinone/menaquinone biosynthesis C-methylase UbiE
VSSTAQPETVHHPLFARLYDRVSRKAEAAGQVEHRREMLNGLGGRVLELGAGNGLNFRHYPDTVEEVLAVEPEAYLRERAGESAAQASVTVHVVDGVADRLPADDASFDGAVASLVLCSVPELDRALAELRRVLRPGGELRFYEHVISRRPGFARFQRVVAPAWPLIAGGCHPDRDTATAIRGAGFEVEKLREFDFRPGLPELPVTPRILGIARRV